MQLASIKTSVVGHSLPSFGGQGPMQIEPLWHKVCGAGLTLRPDVSLMGGFHEKLLKKKIQWEDGYVIPSKEPGPGVELNEEVALAHPYSGTAPHLKMAQHPLGYH